MPELPEVELVARALHSLVAGRTISTARLLRDALAPATSPRSFAKLLRGRRIISVGRRGKHVLFKLDGELFLVAHLRMTGRFLLLPPGVAVPKHTHAVFHLDDKRRLVFTDQRHFGMMKIVNASELHDAKELRSLAPEPFSAEFTPAYLRAIFARTRRTLKETLIDQTKVTGLGNIYAAEAMFIARVNPFAAAADISHRRLPRLHRAILEVFEESIAHGSTMNVDPRDIEGSYYGGAYEGRWRVYDREGQPCLVCRATIHRFAHAGRSTYYCPRCQRR
ncbi:MAG: formamidopyrimidine-DNA glycosylase [Acidobacteriota bacterium]|nr:formamidopyrimidine-DNA glycosylase [Acidobacteriota bacterium]